MFMLLMICFINLKLIYRRCCQVGMFHIITHLNNSGCCRINSCAIMNYKKGHINHIKERLPGRQVNV